MSSLSVAIITLNEEQNIGRTLSAVMDLASQIVVVDSGSEDRTVEIAREMGAEVFIENWRGYSGQRNYALEKCRCDWVLFLDADEVPSEELKKSIKKELKSPSADGYFINRRTFYMGKFLKYTFQPEWRLRLVRRNLNPRWEGEIHERLILPGGRVSKLTGDLYHFSWKDLRDHLLSSVDLAEKSALVLEREGFEPGAGDLTFRPFWNFFKIFILKMGFLDGYRGFIASAVSGFSTFLKYAILTERKFHKRKEANK